MLYTFYGDDFTGSTDVLETLSERGIPTVLFLTPPTPEDLKPFPDVQAVGIAGDSRSRTPEWMSVHLPRLFAILGAFGAPIVHYKTCSTFDSAPHTGSIGRALEIGIACFSPRFVPIVVGKPALGRYVLFGNLFATANGRVYRIDRHPTMSRHPITPMREADLCNHLARQTDLPLAALDFRSLTEESLEAALMHRPAAVVFDTLDDDSLERIGRLVWRQASQGTLFAAGSSGLTQAVMAAWRRGRPVPARAEAVAPRPVDQLLVVSGSCSPVTQAQIESALTHGFHGLAIDPHRLLNDAATLPKMLSRALTILNSGHNLILYTALGPVARNAPAPEAHLGTALGQLLKCVLEQSAIRRTVICGGDTASHVMQQLPVRALTWVASLAPGVSLCRAHSPDPAFHAAEFILKGGQMAGPDFFALARSGGLPARWGTGTQENSSN